MATEHQERRFDLGEIILTPAGLKAVCVAMNMRGGRGPNWIDYMHRHASGDWGDVSDHERVLNDAGCQSQGRLRSIYTLRDGKVIWIVTDGDRQQTRQMLPEEC